MFSIISLILLGMIELFDFTSETNQSSWNIVDDVVMGGRSNGKFYVNEDGHGVFEGRVSLENNGGFSSLRRTVSKTDVSENSRFILRIKGDGKNYQFRVKSKRYDYHSYVFEFSTTGEWQTVEIDFKDMYPTFRGNRLRMDNFPGSEISEMAFLIGNKKNESFSLLIDSIEAE